MNKFLIFKCPAILIVGCVCLAATRYRPQSEETFPSAGAALTNLSSKATSMAGMLSELATERHALDARDGRTWVMGINSRERVMRKYSDDRCVLVLLPMWPTKDDRGLRKYVAAYNDHTERACDQWVTQGRFEVARRVYELLLRTGCNGDAERLRWKLRCLKRIEEGQAVQENKLEIQELSVDLISILHLEAIGDLRTTVVTNLLTVDF